MDLIFLNKAKVIHLPVVETYVPITTFYLFFKE